MNDDTLMTLLVDADCHVGGPRPIAGGLPDRVRARRHRQRVTRITGASSAVAMLLIAAVVWTQWPGTPARHEMIVADSDSAASMIDPAEVARLRAEVDALRAQAEASTLAVEIMQRSNRARDKLAQARPAGRTLDPAIRADCEMEQAAITIVRHADRLLAEHGLTAAAAECYERAIRLFPQTTAAAEARTKLSELKRRKGDLL